MSTDIPKLDKKSKILVIIFFILLIISVFLTYRRTIILNNYPVITPSGEGNVE